jgi:hypothetical protein
MMAEPDDDGGTNIWAPDPLQSYPKQRSSANGEPISASARALAEGWPTQPGWVPEGGLGGAWGEAPAQHAAPQGYIPPPASPATYAATPPAGGTGPQFAPGYPAGGGPTPPPYPGPSAPLPRSNSGVIVAAAVAVIVAVAAGAGAIVYSQRSASPKAAPAATSSALPGAGTSSAPTTAGGSSTGSTGSSSGSTGSTGSSGSGSSGSSSSTPSNLPTAGTDFTTLTLPSYLASPQNAAVAKTLDAYFTGINGSDYENAYSQLTSGQQARNPYSGFVENTGGTIDRDVAVTAVTIRSDRTARASVTFTSSQPADKGVNPGETCTNWSIGYTLVPGSGAGGYLISNTSAQHSAC